MSKSSDIFIDFCNKLIELKNAIINNPSAKTIMTESLNSGKIVYFKEADYEPDPDYMALQAKYNDIISSFNYDLPILAKIATDLGSDLYYNKAELLVSEEFNELNALFGAYLASDIFKKKIEKYMPSTKKIQEIVHLFKSEETSENYNKRLLTILLFLKFKKNTEMGYVDKKYIKSSDYYIASYGSLPDNYRSSFDVGLLEEITSEISPELITGTNTIITQLLSIIIKMYHKTLIQNTGTYDFEKLTGTSILQDFIGLIQKLSEDNISFYGPSIETYLTSDPALGNTIQFIINLNTYLKQGYASQYVIDKIDLLISQLT
jgi:hypothetical protein